MEKFSDERSQLENKALDSLVRNVLFVKTDNRSSTRYLAMPFSNLELCLLEVHYSNACLSWVFLPTVVLLACPSLQWYYVSAWANPHYYCEEQVISEWLTPIKAGTKGDNFEKYMHTNVPYIFGYTLVYYLQHLMIYFSKKQCF